MNTKNTIDFFIVGAARCGTTTLYNHLRSQKNIFLPNVKEPNYFSDAESLKKEDYKLPEPNIDYHAKIIKSEEVYNALFFNAKKGQLKGDTSPSYIWDKKTAQKIYKHNPKAKIIISLRNPVDRAYSHYIMNYYTGVDKNKTFVDALKSKKNDVWGNCNQYLDMSTYYEQVKVYFDIFPKNQIKILIYEDWVKNLNDTINGILEFLQVENLDSIPNKEELDTNKIKRIKKLWLLNILRNNGIKAAIKRVISQEQIDSLKNLFFNDDSEIKKLDGELKSSLLLNFKNDIKLLSKLTNIDFEKKWE